MRWTTLCRRSAHNATPHHSRSRLRLIALVMIGSAGQAGGVVAQIVGLPVRNAGVPSGFGIAADLGFSNADAGKGTTVGLTAGYGLGPLGITGSVTTASVGFTGNITVLGGRLPVSVTLQGGAAYDNRGGSNNWNIPLGIGVALRIRTRGLSIKPWVAPRVSITGDTPDQYHSGISGGVDLGFPSGLSIRAMYDRAKAEAGASPSVLSLGLGFQLGK